MIKFLTDLYNRIFNTGKSLVSIFIPPNSFSWQTLIILSIFSWLMSLIASFVATDILKILLANLGWIFLILGIYWVTSANKSLRIGDVPLSIWITGAIVSIYLFGIVAGKLSPKALVIWPLISAVIGLLPPCLTEDVKLKIPPIKKRQNLVLLVTSQLLISCCFQFYFVVQSWLNQYPSLLADDFKQSAFVVQVEYPSRFQPNLIQDIESQLKISASNKQNACTQDDELPKKKCRQPRGIFIVNQMALQLEKEFNNQPWSKIEKNLLPQERDRLIAKIATQAKQVIASDKVLEDNLWQVGHAITTQGDGYNLELQAIWQGPRSQTSAHSITKSCNITPVDRETGSGTIKVGKLNCPSPKGWGIDQPIVAFK